MKARRTLRRRIWLVALSGAFSVAGVFLLLVGLARLQAVQRRDSELQGLYRLVLSYTAEMQREVTILNLQGTSASAEHLLGLVEECEEALADMRDASGGLLQEQPAFEQMANEWNELSLGERHNGWARYATDLEAFEEHLDSVREGLEERLMLARQTAVTFCGAGVVAASIAALLSVWVLLTVLSDIASESYDPKRLGEEVAALATNPHFKTHINLLLPAGEREDTNDDWELRVTRCFPGKRTHVCFEAAASRNGKQINLWGRRYKWAGFVKSRQRIFFPAFSEATWRALCLMHNNGLGSPVPIVFKKLRAGPFKGGAIILMEHVGEVKSVRQFLESGFCLLSRAEQDAFLHRVVALLHSLHRLGIYGIKPRYLHGKRMEDVHRMQLYLFDLDKVLLGRAWPALIGGMLRSKDYHRLLRQAESVLSHARLLKLRDCLRARQEPDISET